MEMRASEDVDIGQDLTPPLPPLAFSLLDSVLHSYCAACFSSLPPPPHRFPPLVPSFPIDSHYHVPLIQTPVLYCSHQCAALDSDLHFSSAEHNLFQLLPSPLLQSHLSDTSDLRLALRLLRCLEKLRLIPRIEQGCERIAGLMCNREALMSCNTNNDEHEDDDGLSSRIKQGAKAMSMARRMLGGVNLDFERCVLEEAVLCSVITNAVEVQDISGRAVGIAVYDTTFSWINHSCTPNACYRFSSPENQQHSASNLRLRIIPVPMNTGAGRSNLQFSSELAESGQRNGPRVIVRSIKSIKKGEGVCIAYTDLLQPKAMRQSELWFKYQFICCCKRCSAPPETCVDRALEEISVVNLKYTNLSSDGSCRDAAVRKLTDYADHAITEFLSTDNAISCCEKLEHLLAHGLLDEEQIESVEHKSPKKLNLCPLHHLSLNACTTLSSAYKIRASDLLALNLKTNKHELEAFSLSRSSAAYSLLLAAATNRLFLLEPSIIASVANFCISAGESLLSLSQSSVWNLIAKMEPSISAQSFPCYKCNGCALLDVFVKVGSVGSQNQGSELEEISRQFVDCISSIITPQIWSFLSQESRYLKLIKDPINLSWDLTMKSCKMFDSEAACCDITAEGEEAATTCGNQERMAISWLGVHCLLYGGYLFSICYGRHSHVTCIIRNFLCAKDKSAQ